MNFNPYIWFTDREISFLPKHFVKTQSPMTAASKHWVESKLMGRYYIGPAPLEDDTSIYMFRDDIFYFEDPKEAMMYELVWSGK